MSLFATVLAVVMTGIMGISRSTVRVQGAASSQTDVWEVFTTLDQQVRYADAINLPGTVGDTSWVEYRGITAGGGERCYQWRYVSSTGVLQTRSWLESGSPSAGSWSTVLTTALRSSTASPFTTLAPTAALPHQQLKVNLAVTARGDGASALSAAFVARNTSLASPGYQSSTDKPVCNPTANRS
ncbi:hypothetical protein [Quadrisphaera granulorum]|nr:hypothetical protein [Quadrisphaera granulorum]